MNPRTASTNPPPLAEGARAFLREHGIPNAVDATPLAGGANNRVYCLQGGDRDLVLKCYFANPTDPRDRFGAERAFYQWAWSNGIRRTPEPVAWCKERGLGLLEFLPGRRLNPAEVGATHIREALDFVTEINAPRGKPQARGLPSASEACFSVAEHLACVDGRVARLGQIHQLDPVDARAADFVRSGLAPAWEEVRREILERGTRTGVDPQRRLEPPHRCLSPSDFGFHNALPGSDGRLRFFDFEYAGWDDPAKLMCDFFCQPKVPVPISHWDTVLEHLAARLAADARFAHRARLLLPAYRIKWCCILLNDFVVSDEARRSYAAPNQHVLERKGAQLDKAEAALARLW